MKVEDIGEGSHGAAANRHFVHSALLLSGMIFALAGLFCLFSIATRQTGSSGPWGVAGAAALCLIGGWSADAISAFAHGAWSSLIALLAGAAIRLLPPLVVCMVLALRGGGREHLAFVVYLLVFYLVVLALDTWWAVRRVPGAAGHSNHRSS
jgi:hypothetical protein